MPSCTIRNSKTPPGRSWLRICADLYRPSARNRYAISASPSALRQAPTSSAGTTAWSASVAVAAGTTLLDEATTSLSAGGTLDGETAFKLWTAKAFYRIINRLAETRIPPDTGDFRLMDRAAVDALLSMPERDRFVRCMVSWLGFSQVAVPYMRASRYAGQTHYSLFKMLRLAMDGILSFSISPLRLATWTGFVASALAILGIVYALIEHFFGTGLVKGWTSSFIAVLFIGGG